MPVIGEMEITNRHLHKIYMQEKLARIIRCIMVHNTEVLYPFKGNPHSFRHAHRLDNTHTCNKQLEVARFTTWVWPCPQTTTDDAPIQGSSRQPEDMPTASDTPTDHTTPLQQAAKGS